YGCQGGRHREGHRECQSLVVVLPSAQPGDRVDGRDDEAGGHVDRDEEMPELVAERAGEQSCHHVDVGHVPADELHAAWCVHERVGGQDRDRAQQARRRQRKAKDRKSTRLNSSHVAISYAVFCLKKKKTAMTITTEITVTPSLKNDSAS